MWLGHDDEASYDAIADKIQDPYTTLQVVGCAVAVGLVTIVLAALTEPVASALGVGRVLDRRRRPRTTETTETTETSGPLGEASAPR